MIPVNQPVISKSARKYLNEALRSGWISSRGPFIERFENEFVRFIGTEYAVTTTSGTTALHLALAALGIGPGDEVIIPDLTIISCALTVIYTGATPVLVDVDPVFGNIDPDKIEEKITGKTKAIMVVHLYGQPAEMDKILAVAKKHKLLVIEDAAEAHGGEIQIQRSKVKGQNYNSKLKNEKNLQWKKVGSIGDVGCFSFYGNKIITTGEGGMVVTNSKRIYQKLKSLKDLAHSPKKRFLHSELGFNYRMTNLQAALGLAQLEEVEKYIAKKVWMAKEYEKNLKNIPFLELPQQVPRSRSVYWMYAVKVKKGSKIKRDMLRKKLLEKGIDTRDFFYPLHKQPVLKKLGLFKGVSYPVSLDLSNRGFYLPSGLAITRAQIQNIARVLQKLENGILPQQV